MCLRLVFASLFIVVVVTAAHAQTTTSSHHILSNSAEDDSHPHGADQNLSELRARNAIKREETIHAETLERAREVAKLGTQLRETFARVKSLATDDLKKLARMEKLTRKIRGDAGGTGDGDPSKDLPDDKPEAISRLAKLADELREHVEKTPRHVISAAVVARSNQLLELIERIRQFSK
ncbi:MAG: hypothetical protein NVSMB56_20520 [Pyrinomonadaceae bacterium]